MEDPIDRVYDAVDAEFPREEAATPPQRTLRPRTAPRPSMVFISDEEDARERQARMNRIKEDRQKRKRGAFYLRSQ